MNNRFYNEDNIEIIEIDDYEIEIIEIDETPLNNLETYNKKIDNRILSKIRQKLTIKKAAVVTVGLVTLLVTLTGVFILNKNIQENEWKSQSNIVYSNTNENIEFNLIEPEYNTVLINTQYEEKGANIIIDGIDKSDEIKIDASNINTSKIGTYHVIYTYPVNINQVKTLYRTINVIDTEAPQIKLLGSNAYTMLVNDIYEEAGVIVSDNSGEELIDHVEIENNINSSRPGTYYVKYSVKDSSGNESVAYRIVEVKYSYTTNTNSITYNSFTDTGIFIKGTVQNNSFSNRILLKNKNDGNEIILDTQKISNHYYQILLDVTQLSNGTYEFYLLNSTQELLTNNMNNYSKIVRAHIGNKLVTMDYSKSKVNMTVEDFEYQYDIVIDPGHGGADTGATNGRYVERNINLEQSLYEKERYEQHGLKVLLLRDTNSNYGITMGDANWEPVEQKAYAVGYYGSVSRVIYSNHHNSSGNSSSAGWEILVPAAATYEDLSIEHKIADIWSNIYVKQTNPYYRFYTRDFQTGTANNKINGETYSFEDYYSVIRIPNKLFNVQNVLYEGAYVNNSSDMHWYYTSENWKQLSEVKIKAYVESLGIEYIEP